jgi:uncharacterized protein (UPF0335 family)
MRGGVNPLKALGTAALLATTRGVRGENAGTGTAVNVRKNRAGIVAVPKIQNIQAYQPRNVYEENIKQQFTGLPPQQQAIALSRVQEVTQKLSKVDTFFEYFGINQYLNRTVNKTQRKALALAPILTPEIRGIVQNASLTFRTAVGNLQQTDSGFQMLDAITYFSTINVFQNLFTQNVIVQTKSEFEKTAKAESRLVQYRSNIPRLEQEIQQIEKESVQIQEELTSIEKTRNAAKAYLEARSESQKTTKSGTL